MRADPDGADARAIAAIAAALGALPNVVAVVLGGSRATGVAGLDSDVDLDVYADVYDWYLGDFQNRDMALVSRLVYSARMPEAQARALFARAYEIGQSL